MKYLQITLKPVTIMLRDIQPIIPNPNSLDVTQNHEIGAILSFIDTNIPDFKLYYKLQAAPDRENRISDLLVHFLQCCKQKYQDGFLPYDIRKNPTQFSSGRESDIGVYVLAMDQTPLLPIFEFEAKRLSNSSNNKEYVCGNRGGIERFKRRLHSSHLSTCGMFGYIQNDDANSWINKINAWIKELAQQQQQDETIDWTKNEELLSLLQSFPGVEKLKSHNYRKESDDSITLFHYMIDLN